jgi:hypothetical protein
MKLKTQEFNIEMKERNYENNVLVASLRLSIEGRRIIQICGT